MVESHWPEIEEKELRYLDRTWALTGDVTVENTGNTLGVAAKQADGVRHGRATLYFEVEDASDSLNPGNLGEHFDRLEREGDSHYLEVKKEGRTYRYELRRMEPE